VGYTIHRPFGRITVAIKGGKELFSRDLGIPGKVYSTIAWEPARFATDKEKDHLLNVDPSFACTHTLGNTDAVYSSDPEWNMSFHTHTNKRLSQLLDVGKGLITSSESKNDFPIFTFPILQPIVRNSARRNDNGKFTDVRLLDWADAPGALVFQVKFQDFLNNLPGFDHVLGEAVVPISEIAKTGEWTGWLQIQDSGNTERSGFEAVLGDQSNKNRT